MNGTRIISPVVAIVIAIGCSGKPQDAAATSRGSGDSAAPIQLAQVAATPTPAAGGSDSATTGGASIRGTIRFDGTAPSQEKIQMSADPVCQQQHATPVYAEDVAVNSNGTLKNVFIYVKSGVQGSFPVPTQPVTLQQSGCWYAPHVFGIQANQPLEIVNNDSTLHNINAKPTSNQPFNVAQPVKGMKTTKKFTTPEIMVKFKCNVHPWMNAYAGVRDNPFFSTSGDNGSFAIAGLPAGTYTIEAWHEKFGTQTQEVTVGNGETKSIDFTFKDK